MQEITNPNNSVSVISIILNFSKKNKKNKQTNVDKIIPEIKLVRIAVDIIFFLFVLSKF
jgi:hypothetical protein